jgi:hypothetical protein
MQTQRSDGLGSDRGPVSSRLQLIRSQAVPPASPTQPNPNQTAQTNRLGRPEPNPTPAPPATHRQVHQAVVAQQRDQPAAAGARLVGQPRKERDDAHAVGAAVRHVAELAGCGWLDWIVGTGCCMQRATRTQPRCSMRSPLPLTRSPAPGSRPPPPTSACRPRRPEAFDG